MSSHDIKNKFGMKRCGNDGIAAELGFIRLLAGFHVRAGWQEYNQDPVGVFTNRINYLSLS
ncbi:MAG: hypothetical protein ACXVNM_00825 [Bacteroidia bacterium]